MKISLHKYTHYLIASISILFLFLCSTSFANQTIKIGVPGPMKYIPGQIIFSCTSLAAEEINNAGGVTVKGKKYQIEVVKADTNEFVSLPDAVSAMERLITVDKVDFTIGGYTTESTLAMMEPMADHKVIFLSITSCHVKQTETVAQNYNRYKYFFRVGPPNTEYVGLVAAHQFLMYIEGINKRLGVAKPRVAVINEKGLWSEANVANAVKNVPKEKFEIVGNWVIARMATDVVSEMTAIKAAKPHIVLMAFSGPVGVIASRAWGNSKSQPL